MINRMVDLTSQAKESLLRTIPNVKIQSVNRRRQDFLFENPEWENHEEERERIHYLFLCITRGFLSTSLHLLRFSLSPLCGGVLIYK